MDFPPFLRCTRTGNGNWRCEAMVAPGRSYCMKHYLEQRRRNERKRERKLIAESSVTSRPMGRKITAKWQSSDEDEEEEEYYDDDAEEWDDGGRMDPVEMGEKGAKRSDGKWGGSGGGQWRVGREKDLRETGRQMDQLLRREQPRLKSLNKPEKRGIGFMGGEEAIGNYSWKSDEKRVYSGVEEENFGKKCWHPPEVGLGRKRSKMCRKKRVFGYAVVKSENPWTKFGYDEDMHVP